MVKGKQLLVYSATQGKQLVFPLLEYFGRDYSEWRLCAMMAAQGLDVLWIRSSLSLIFLAIVASGTKNGTCGTD